MPFVPPKGISKRPLEGAGENPVHVMLLRGLDRLPAAALSIAVAYGSFVFAESVLHASGVMAAVAAGIMIGGLMESRAHQPVRELLRDLWDALGTWSPDNFVLDGRQKR